MFSNSRSGTQTARRFLPGFGVSFLLTGLGFLVEGIPLVLAYLPFALALVLAPALTHPRLAVMVLMAGHFLWPALIAGWGLIQLGTPPLVMMAVGTGAVMLVSAGVAWLGMGLSALLLAALPFFPANPLLITGSILPGAGVWGLVALPVLVTVIEIQRSIWMRAVLLITLLILPGLVFPWDDLEEITRPDIPHFEEIDISGDVALTERRHWALIVEHVEDGDHLILGENIFAHDDHAAIFWWCRTVRGRNITAMIGVLGQTGLGEVWLFDAETCPEPVPIYRTRLGIPVVNGGWWPQEADFNLVPDTNSPASEPHWLICFEAFSLWRWVDLGLGNARQDEAQPVVILANDHWTAPIPTALLRRKVSRQFAALFGMEVFHADRGKTVLERLQK